MPEIKWHRIRGGFQGQKACGECGAVCWGPRDQARHFSWHLELGELLGELLGRELEPLVAELTEGMSDPGPGAILERAHAARPGAWAQVRGIFRLRDAAR